MLFKKSLIFVTLTNLLTNTAFASKNYNHSGENHDLLEVVSSIKKMKVEDTSNDQGLLPMEIDDDRNNLIPLEKKEDSFQLCTTMSSDLQAMNKFPRDVWKIILEMASMGAHPSDLQKVCKYWRNIMREHANPKLGLNFNTLNPFLQQCMRLWCASNDPRRFNSGILSYTPRDGGPVINLRFSDLLSPFNTTQGTFDLFACGDPRDRPRITTNAHEFFKIGGDNAGESLILIILHSEAEKAALSMNKDHPFVRVVTNWDKLKAPVGIFFRNGSHNPERFYHVTIESFASLSSMKSLLPLWDQRWSAWPTMQPVDAYDVGGYKGRLYEWSLWFPEQQKAIDKNPR